MIGKQLTNKRITIVNLGCKANKYESDAMADKLSRAGAVMVEPHEVADVYIVNTCSVTNMAEKKSRQMLRRSKKKNPDAIVVAAGCYVNASAEQLENMEFVDLIVGNNCKKDIVEVLEHYFTNQDDGNRYIDINCTKEYEEMGGVGADTLDHQRAYIKIQDGCNQFCSYCIIPYTRGRVRSRKPENILQEIKTLAREGVKEFVLTGIHISSYGLDFRRDDREYDDVMENQDIGFEEENASDNSACIHDLGSLISAIEQIPDVRRIRLGSLEPRIITDDFLNRIGKSDKLCPHFHLSLQSACNETLKRMNRKYTIEEFEEKCNMLRSYFEEPAITTDVIVGFPGETDEEFAITLQNLRHLNLYEIHVFKYSVRSGTVAADLPNQVMEEKKNMRSDILLELTAAQKQEYEDKFIGKSEKVLVEEQIDEKHAGKMRLGKPMGAKDDSHIFYAGHTRNYIKVAVQSDKDILNQIVEVIME